MLLHVARMVFFGEEDMFLQMSWMGIFGAKPAYLYFETPKLQ